MSYLLDALKQSQQIDAAQQHDLALQQQQQQQQLKRYRFLAISFGLILGFCLTLFAGFSIGKWLQSNNQKKMTNQNIEVVTEKNPDSIKEPMKLEKNAEQATKPATSQTIAPNIQPQRNQPLAPSNPNNQQYQWVQVPVNTLSNYSQNQAMINNGGGSQTNAPVMQNTMPNNAAVTTPEKPTNSSETLDLSKYKVLGKAIEQAPEKKMVVANNDEELEGVSDNLKNAFAQAVADTDKVEPHQVTRGTKNSSYAEPIELLPDGLHAMLPKIKYQAHIYSSTPDKRWIKLNNRELFEGDSMGEIRLLEITPEQSVLSFDGYEFSLKALQDWPE